MQWDTLILNSRIVMAAEKHLRTAPESGKPRWKPRKINHGRVSLHSAFSTVCTAVPVPQYQSLSVPVSVSVSGSGFGAALFTAYAIALRVQVPELMPKAWHGSGAD